MLFCLAFSLFVACLPHCTGTGIIQYTLARLYQQLKVHRHGQIGFLSFCLFAQLRLIAHCSPFAVPGNTPRIVSFIQIPTRFIHQQCPLYFHSRFTFIAVLHSDFTFPFCCIFAAGLFWGPRRNRRLRWGERRQASPLWRKAPSDATALPNAWCPVLGAFNAESFAFPPSKRSGVQF